MLRFHWLSLLLVSSLVVNAFAAPVGGGITQPSETHNPLAGSKFHEDLPAMTDEKKTGTKVTDEKKTGKKDGYLRAKLKGKAKSVWTNTWGKLNNKKVVVPSRPLSPLSPPGRPPSPPSHPLGPHAKTPPLPKDEKKPFIPFLEPSNEETSPPLKDEKHKPFSALLGLEPLDVKIGDLIGGNGEYKLYHVLDNGNLRLKVFPAERFKDFKAEITSAEDREEYVNSGKLESGKLAILIKLHGGRSKR